MTKAGTVVSAFFILKVLFMKKKNIEQTNVFFIFIFIFA